MNGKVERSQRTDLDEFYATVDLKDPVLSDQLSEWQHYYNWDRPHSSLDGKTTIERLTELADKTLLWEEVSTKFDPSKERLQEQNYPTELFAKIELMSANRTVSLGWTKIVDYGKTASVGLTPACNLSISHSSLCFSKDRKQILRAVFCSWHLLFAGLFKGVVAYSSL